MRKLTCEERDEILIDWDTGRVAHDVKVVSSLTDLDGNYGDPLITTTWRTAEGVYVRDERHPALGGEGADVEPCEHYEVDNPYPEE